MNNKRLLPGSRKGLALSGIALVCILISGGCARSVRESRRENAPVYQRSLAALTQEELSAKGALDLEGCVEIALKNNLKGKASEIRARVRRLERKAAFANFLPALELNADLTAWDHQQMKKAGEGPSGPTYRATSDREIHKFVVQAQMPIFAPSTWYLYEMRKRGEEIGDLLLDYTRQMITLQVTALYYQCLALEETEKALASRVEAAEAMQKQIELFYQEGMASAWQVDQAEALLLSRRMDFNHTLRALRKTKADLLGAMGLSPLAGIEITRACPLNAPEGGIEDLVLQALLDNPQLRISDRMIEIQRDQARMAIANFLPKLVGFASFTDTSDSFTFDPDYWMSGLSGVLTIFNGFKNINEYKAAREQEREAMVEREEACLAVMLEVIKAYLSVQDAEEGLAVAQKSLQVAKGRMAEVEAKWAEGLIELPERLNAIAEVEGAERDAVNARFSQQVSVATLMNVLGKGHVDKGIETVERAKMISMADDTHSPATKRPLNDSLVSATGNPEGTYVVNNSGNSTSKRRITDAHQSMHNSSDIRKGESHAE